MYSYYVSVLNKHQSELCLLLMQVVALCFFFFFHCAGPLQVPCHTALCFWDFIVYTRSRSIQETIVKAICNTVFLIDLFIVSEGKRCELHSVSKRNFMKVL